MPPTESYLSTSSNKMGVTKKAIAKEVESVYENIILGLHKEVSVLTSEEKADLRDYIAELSNSSKNHSFSHIFIMRKIDGLVRAREGCKKTIVLEGIPQPEKKPSFFKRWWLYRLLSQDATPSP